MEVPNGGSSSSGDREETAAMMAKMPLLFFLFVFQFLFSCSLIHCFVLLGFNIFSVQIEQFCGMSAPSLSRRRIGGLAILGSRTRENKDDLGLIMRRDIIGLGFGVSSLLMIDSSHNAMGAGLPPEEKPRLCDDTCEKELENVPMVTTESGLQYKDIKVGRGPSPPIGFQVAANYVAMVPSLQIFDSSLEKGQIYIFRVGSGQVIKGLDEGILSMKTGGKRRLYIPGPLAFPKGLTSAPGRPRVAPNSPVVFDVSLEYIPGLEAEEE